MSLTTRSHEGNAFLSHCEYLHPYHPYSSSKFDAASGRILDFKEGQQYAVNYYATLVHRRIPKDAVLTVVPSHDPQKKSGPLHRLAAKLVQKSQRRTNAAGCLVRHTLIPKLSRGGRRHPRMHRRSIRVEQRHLIKRRRIILLDDVTTTGGSFKACRRLLLDAGAGSVHCFALAKTMR